MAFLILAGCSSNAAPERGNSVASAISPTDESVIVLNVSDSLPVKSARLIAPDGQSTEAFAIDRDSRTYRNRGGGQPSMGIGVGGGSGGGVSTGIGLGFPIFSSSSGGTQRITDSRVQIRIPDIATYRQAWQRYTLAIDLDDGVNRRSFQTVPPAPR